MKGNIYFIKNNSYGFINGDDGKEYYFHKVDLRNCTIYQLTEGNRVEFRVVDCPNEKRGKATYIRKLDAIKSVYESDTNPGINELFKFDGFNDDEIKIINKLKETFYVTNGGSIINLGQSNYRYCLVKPTNVFSLTFNIKRELIVIFSDYVSFEPRSLDVAATVAKQIPSKLRIDRGCQILISSDERIEEKLSDILKDTNLNSIVIPFSYRELLADTDKDFIIKRFRKYLFDVDLFSTSIPIQNDLFFFGRRDYVFDITNKCKNNIHSGVFGLRRSGKTSLLYAVKRLLENDSIPTIYIPCQSQFSKSTWQLALYELINDIKQEISVNGNFHSKNSYKIENAAICFEDDLNILCNKVDKPIVLLFDEIESITFAVPGNLEQWKSGEYYVPFWDAIRGYYSKYPKAISIVVAGTNPMINEVPVIGDVVNPMYGQLSKANQGAYLPPFTTIDTQNMVNTLGGYMGVTFDDNVCSMLTIDCGGHPYLIRLLCSYINQMLKNEDVKRPKKITKALYEPAINKFEDTNEATGFYLMILNILITSYEKEFNVLKEIAINGDEYVSNFVDDRALLHLLGYGLIESNEGRYSIKFNTIKRYLLGKYKFERTNLSVEDQKEEIQFRIDAAEIKLRELIKTTLLVQKGNSEARQIVLRAMEGHKAIADRDLDKAQTYTLNQLFDPSVNKVYLSVLMKIILDNYPLFKNVFAESSVSEVTKHFSILNVARRVPDHSYTDESRNWNREKFLEFRISMSWLEDILNPA